MAINTNRTGSKNIGIGSNTSTYSNTGSRQLNINDALIGLEFKKGRTNSQVYTALNSYFDTTGLKSSCIGFCEGDYISRIERIDASTIRLYGNSYHDITNSSTQFTNSSRTILYFINPKMSSDISDDCVS